MNSRSSISGYLTVLSLFIAMFFASCKPVAEEEYDGAAEFEVIDQFWQGFDNNDPDSWSAILTEDARLMGPGLTDSLIGVEFIDEWKGNFDSEISALVYSRTARRFIPVTIEENPILAGNWVMEWGTVNIDFMDSTSASFWWHGAFRINEGKINLARFFFDNADVFRQRGFTISPPFYHGKIDLQDSLPQ